MKRDVDNAWLRGMGSDVEPDKIMWHALHAGSLLLKEMILPSTRTVSYALTIFVICTILLVLSQASS